MTSGGHDGPGLDGAAEAFRLEVCEWLTERLAPAQVAAHRKPSERTGLAEPFERELHREAGARGWLDISLPAKVGGGGKPATFAAAFGFEAAYHDAPLIDTAIVLAGAPVVAFGTPDQHRELLSRMRSGEVEMCIAYTEPGAGNDLAALTTAAVLQPDGSYLLDGHKALITGADKADVCLTIARTDPAAPVRRGSSMFLVDMTLPGVEVRPQRMMPGYDLWEVLFHRVALPPQALLGTRDGGWKQLAYAVEHERTGVFTLGWCQRLFDEILADASAGTAGRRALDDPVIADRLGRLWADLQAGRRSALALVEEEVSANRSGVTASVAKVALTELAQRLAQVGTELAPANARLGHEYLFRFEGGVSVGANELHRTGIAAALGVRAPKGEEPPASLDVLADGDPLRERVRGLVAGWDQARLEGAAQTAPGYDAAMWSDVQALAPPELARRLVLVEELAFAACPTPIRSRLIEADVLRAQGKLEGTVPTGWAVALQGAPADIEYGDSLEGLLVPVDVRGERCLVAVALDAPGVARVPRPTLSSNHLTHITLTPVAFAGSAVVSRLAVEDVTRLARLTGIVALGAEAVGHAAALLSATVERVHSRLAFGSPLASLPTVQQRVADMYLDFIAARAAVREAAQALEADARSPRLDALVSAAKLTSIDAALRIAAGAHQLCGGWGQLWETGLHHHTRAIKTAEGQLGRPHEHAAVIGGFLRKRHPGESSG